ncbi:MAG: DUF4810 domain-containing protein [Phycisphaeraceae bacterium]|nr:DUF4810 domain-containing protein [Phycisphaeraceae bacterium]
METQRRIKRRAGTGTGDAPLADARGSSMAALPGVGAVLGLVLLAGALAGGGCAETWQYDWGSYEKSVWLMYAPPSDKGADVGQQIDKLAKEIHKTEERAKPGEASRVPPGKYAHLGYLYAQQGDKINARQCLEAEKRLYPESTRFIDGLLARMP